MFIFQIWQIRKNKNGKNSNSTAENRVFNLFHLSDDMFYWFIFWNNEVKNSKKILRICTIDILTMFIFQKFGNNNYRNEISRCDLNDEFAGCVRSGIRAARSGRYRLDRLVALVVRDVGWSDGATAGCGRSAALPAGRRRPQEVNQVQPLA